MSESETPMDCNQTYREYIRNQQRSEAENRNRERRAIAALMVDLCETYEVAEAVLEGAME